MEREPPPRVPRRRFSSQVWSGGLWHGLYHWFKYTPKRQRLYSNDCVLLREIVAVAGQLQPGDLKRFQGDPLTKRRRGADGKVWWSGAGQAMTESQCLV